MCVCVCVCLGFLMQKMEGFTLFIEWIVGFSAGVVWTKGGRNLGESKVGFNIVGMLVRHYNSNNVCCITQTFSHISSSFYTSSHIGNPCRSPPLTLFRTSTLIVATIASNTVGVRLMMLRFGVYLEW